MPASKEEKIIWRRRTSQGRGDLPLAKGGRKIGAVSGGGPGEGGREGCDPRLRRF